MIVGLIYRVHHPSTWAVVVPSFNHADDAIACLDSLWRAHPRPGFVVLVDDASTDNAVQKISRWASEQSIPQRVVPAADLTSKKGEIPWLTLARSDRNEGFVRTSNAGLRYVRDSHRSSIRSALQQRRGGFAFVLCRARESTGARAGRRTAERFHLRMGSRDRLVRGREFQSTPRARHARNSFAHRNVAARNRIRVRLLYAHLPPGPPARRIARRLFSPVLRRGCGLLAAGESRRISRDCWPLARSATTKSEPASAARLRAHPPFSRSPGIACSRCAGISVDGSAGADSPT